jgi:hypothetical protein
MNPDRFLLMSLFAFLCFIFSSQPAAMAQSLKERNEVVLEQLKRVHDLPEEQMDSIRALFRASGVMGEGNPAIVKHPMTPDG